MNHDPSLEAAAHRLREVALAATGATAVVRLQSVQRLWSGYGEIVRCFVRGGTVPSVIVKHVRWPQQDNHPRGWNSTRSHERKVFSYGVESHWYEAVAAKCGASARTPDCLAADTDGEEVFLVLEDLDGAGFGRRCTSVDWEDLHACLRWLANFHATFLGHSAEGLWPEGTYWHLGTRPDELAELRDGPLKRGAAPIDRMLREARFQTLVHGDAKLANFCFSETGHEVAAVDFQYVGGGCGMKDLAYFVSSCLDEDQSALQEEAVLDAYFSELRAALRRQAKTVDLDGLEEEWRGLYPVAWTDFYRFLKGWSPGHWKLHRYSERLAAEVLAAL